VLEVVRPLSVKGKLTFVNPEYNSASKVNEVRMEIDNQRGDVKPGMRANVTVITNAKSMPAVPTNAVIREERGATVWIRTGKNTFVSRMVHIGLEADGFTEIIHGLKKGDVVVISGAYLIHSEYLFRQGANPMEGHDMNNM
jgi:Cu(I)/Ag(I) efflux system membrane fusion protein